VVVAARPPAKLLDRPAAASATLVSARSQSVEIGSRPIVNVGGHERMVMR